MIDLSKNSFRHLSPLSTKLKEVFTNHLDDNIKIPGALLSFVFSPSFFQSEIYLIFPYLFKKAFRANETFAEKLCVSGFLYFKYLLAVDELIDNDSPDKKNDGSAMTLLKSHIYHEESLKILASLFGKNKTFWELWNKRNNEFLKSIMLDKEYNPAMTFDTYKMLSITKCAFSKVAVDAYFSRLQPNEQNTKIYNDLIQSIDYFSIARCIQDDLEDFSKDLEFKKNNLGHIYLNEWLTKQEKNIQDQPKELLEKQLFTSETAERMLATSRDYYQKAMDQVADYQHLISDYVKMLENLRNNVNHFKVNIQAYRIDKYVSTLNANAVQKKHALKDAIELSGEYIANMQNNDGSWFEISNMQGLSNVWATGFISSFLAPDNESARSAKNFLLNNKQGKLWGYNTDWTFDFDSTTCVLLSLNNLSENVDTDVQEWIKGQNASGGFSTYSGDQYNLFSNMGLKKKDVRGWIREHTCVSALAYYFMNALPTRDNYQRQLNSLKNYILSNRNRHGVWKPYWWTSCIYPTSFIVQAMLKEEELQEEYLHKAMDFIIKQQNTDGSFSCEVLKNKSAFYTAMVLDTICVSEKLFSRYRENATSMKDWLLEHQYSNGYFNGSDFLVIPNPNVIRWNETSNTFKLRKTGGGNSITGEIANLFSTAVGFRALQRFSNLN